MSEPTEKEICEAAAEQFAQRAKAMRNAGEVYVAEWVKPGLSKPDPVPGIEPPLTVAECYEAFEELRNYITGDFPSPRPSDRTLFIACCEWSRLGMLGGRPPALPEVDPRYLTKTVDTATIPMADFIKMGAPIDMILFCPSCGLQHVDAPDPKGTREAWTNPPHRSHLCQGCGHLWKPADVATNGVAELVDVGAETERIRGIASSVKHYKGEIE